MEELVKIQGSKKGPTSIILAGVHGNEIPGIEALSKILPEINIDSGAVLFGYGNPRAIRANKRYTEANLNRLFVSDDELPESLRDSYEYQRAQFLKKYLDDSDVLLDIHASSTPNSKAFVICEQNAFQIAQYLPVDLVVSGFDEVEPGGTDYYMNKKGKIGICVECGYIKDKASLGIAVASIKDFLKARGHHNNDLSKSKQSYARMYKKYYSSSNNFVLSKKFDDFEIIQQGQMIGIDGNKEIRAEKAGFILFAQNSSNVGEEIFLMGEQKETPA